MLRRGKLLILMMLVIIFMLTNNKIIYAINLNGKILNNIYVQDINLSDLTKEEATKKINSYIEQNNEFELFYNNESILVNKETLGVDYKVDELVDRAYSIGRDKDLITDMKTKISLKKGEKKIIPLTCSYNIKKVDNLIDKIYSKLYISPKDASAKIVDGNIVVYEEHKGQAVNKENLKDIIVYKIENLDSSQSEIPLDVLNPKYTYDQLMKIDTLLGSYETYFNPKRKNRVNNITVAAKSTSDILVNTNEKFSFNQQLRDNDAYNKLKVASIILNGKHDKGVGGGICQVSTTIYNAALYAGMDIVKITNHSIPSPYVTKGRDATVSNGSMDFVFKNNNNNPIIVHNEIFENKIVSKIYGCSSDKRNIEIETKIVETIKNKKIYKSDSKLQKGTKVVEQEGRLGYTVNTFRLYKSNNEILKKELVNTSYYPPCDEIILKGTKDNTLYK